MAAKCFRGNKRFRVKGSASLRENRRSCHTGRTAARAAKSTAPPTRGRISGRKPIAAREPRHRPDRRGPVPRREAPPGPHPGANINHKPQPTADRNPPSGFKTSNVRTYGGRRPFRAPPVCQPPHAIQWERTQRHDPSAIMVLPSRPPRCQSLSPRRQARHDRKFHNI